MHKISIIIFLYLFSNFTGQNVKDEEAIMQKCIDIKNFIEMLHERPLIILDNGKISSKIKLNKFNKPVIFLSQKELDERKLKAFVVVKEFIIKKDSAIVSLRYKIEGIGAEISLLKKNKKWNIVKEHVYEN